MSARVLPDPSAVPDRGLRSAVLLGLSAGMRTMTPEAVMVTRGRLTSNPVGRLALIGGAAVEIGADKHPETPNRTEPQGLVGRLISGAAVGHAVGGRPGAVAGLAASAFSSIACQVARSGIVERTGLPDVAVAVGEDLLAVGTAALGVRLAPPAATTDGTETSGDGTTGTAEPVSAPRPLDALLRGVVAAGAGTAAMTASQIVYHRLTGTSDSDAPARAGEKLWRTTTGRRVAQDHEVFNQEMHWAYGVSWGIPLGLALGSPGAAGGPLGTGVGFGLAVWGAGLVHQPLTGISPPVWRQSWEDIAADAGFHLVYGLGSGPCAAAEHPGSARSRSPGPRTASHRVPRDRQDGRWRPTRVRSSGDSLAPAEHPRAPGEHTGTLGCPSEAGTAMTIEGPAFWVPGAIVRVPSVSAVR